MRVLREESVMFTINDDPLGVFEIIFPQTVQVWVLRAIGFALIQVQLSGRNVAILIPKAMGAGLL